MKRLSIVLSILLLAAPSLGCALESSGADGQSAVEPGTNDLVEGSKDDPTLVHTGTAGNLGLENGRGVSLPSQLPITESDDGNGPQPEPWAPPLSIRSAGESSGDNHK